MKILIISDTHRKDNNFLKIMEDIGTIDLLIHLGDVEGSEEKIAKAAGCPVEMVAGNNDFFSDLPSEKTLQIGKYHVMITHGHRYYIGMGNEMLKQEAVAQGADIVIDISKNIIAINPGSLSYPRQENRKPSYMIMELDSAGEAHFNLYYIE